MEKERQCDVTRALECGDLDMVSGPPGCAGWGGLPAVEATVLWIRGAYQKAKFSKKKKATTSKLHLGLKQMGMRSKSLLMGKKMQNLNVENYVLFGALLRTSAWIQPLG